MASVAGCTCPDGMVAQRAGARYRSVRPVAWGQGANSPCTATSRRLPRWSCSSRHELVGREILVVKLAVTPFWLAGARSTPCRCRARRSRTPLCRTCSPAAATADGLPSASPARSAVFCATSFITSISSSRSAPASSAAHSWSSGFSRRTSLAPAVDRLFADPVPLGHRQHQLAIRLAQDRHYLPSVKRALRIAPSESRARLSRNQLVRNSGARSAAPSRRQQDRPGHFLRRRFFVFLG